MKLTKKHSSSSYGQPVLVASDGRAYGVADLLPNGQTGVEYVQSHPRCGGANLRTTYINLHLASTGQEQLPYPRRKNPKLRGRAASMAAYTDHNRPATVAAVEALIPDELRLRLTGREYGLVMSAVKAAYHKGRASRGELEDRLLTEKETAELLGVKPGTLRTWRCDRKYLPFIRVGSSVRYRLKDILRWQDQNRVNTD